MLFQDRSTAGRELAAQVARLVSTPAVVAAFPNGGVEVAVPVAEAIGASLTVAHARALVVPDMPDVAFGAVDEDGHVVLNSSVVAGVRLTPAEIETAKADMMPKLQARRLRYGAAPIASFLPGRVAVLVVEQLSSGLVMEAAVRHARRRGAPKIVVATPCSTPRMVELFREEADAIVALHVDAALHCLADCYRDFPPVGDDDVVRMLAWARDNIRVRDRRRREAPPPDGER